MLYKLGKHEIELYDSVHNLGVLRFQKFNKYLMQSIEVGNTFADFDRLTAKTIQFLEKEMYPEAIKQMENRRQSVFNAYNEFTPSGKALAILVKRINDRVFEDFSPDALDRILIRLDKIGFSYGEAIDKVSEVKKNSIRNYAFTIRNFFQKTQIATKQH